MQVYMVPEYNPTTNLQNEINDLENRVGALESQMAGLNMLIPSGSFNSGTGFNVNLTTSYQLIGTCNINLNKPCTIWGTATFNVSNSSNNRVNLSSYIQIDSVSSNATTNNIVARINNNTPSQQNISISQPTLLLSIGNYTSSLYCKIDTTSNFVSIIHLDMFVMGNLSG